MKERPILFSGAMVRAILDGSKKQTRRVCNSMLWNQGEFGDNPSAPHIYGQWAAHKPCPYGQPGDRLWVRETWAHVPKEDGMGYIYRADGESAFDQIREGWSFTGPWKPSIFCTRAASRITLEITAVRVERLQEIDWIDAKREGVRLEDCEIGPAPDFNIDYQGGYRRLWESINGPGSWDANPFVWVVEFNRIKP